MNPVVDQTQHSHQMTQQQKHLAHSPVAPITIKESYTPLSVLSLLVFCIGLTCQNFKCNCLSNNLRQQRTLSPNDIPDTTIPANPAPSICPILPFQFLALMPHGCQLTALCQESNLTTLQINILYLHAPATPSTTEWSFDSLHSKPQFMDW